MSIFRVRNLLIQVLEPLTCETDSACAQNASEEPAICGEDSVAAGLKERWACDCSLHFDTKCDIWRFSLVCRSPGITLECVPGGVTLVNKDNQIAEEPCPDPNSGCQVLVSLPLCPKITDTGCEKIVNSGVVMETPAGVCFRSDEPRLNPNSLADLGVLRRQLALGLKIVERHERALAEALTPRTQDQIEKAEAVLRTALEDLQNSKQHIQSRASAEAKTSKKTAAKKSARKSGAGR